ncbi:MAG: alanine racemase [Nannocystaceae bacterium]
MRLQQLDTPCLLLDRGTLDRNIAAMEERLRPTSVSLRPHVKTAKTAEAVKRMTGGGAGGITVSTLREAEHFFELGYQDITYAVGIAPNKLERIGDLMLCGAELNLLADHVDQVAFVSAFGERMGRVLPVLIEVDSDARRAGLHPGGDALLDVGRLLDSAPGTSLAGVLTHAGGSYACRTRSAIVEFAEQERRAVVDAAQRLRAAGLVVPVVSVGSTPTVMFAERFDGVTEVRAGVYVFNDLTMAGLGVCRHEDIAISVLCSVIGHQRARNWVITDAGWMALSSDRSTASQRVDWGYGLVCDVAGRVIEDLLVTATSQEHGIVGHRDGRPLDFEKLAVGTKLRVLPNHACATAAAHEGYVVVAGGEEVVDRWSRFRGW